MIKWAIDSTDLQKVPINEIDNNLRLLLSKKSSHWRIVPLIHKNLIKQRVFDSLDSKVKNQLSVITKKAVVNDLAMKSQVKTVAKEFENNNIDIILIKGAAFSDWLYDSEYPRGARDIDILVKDKDYPRAYEILSRSMYRFKRKDAGPLNGLYEDSFIPKTGFGAHVDLHRSLTYPDLFNVNEDEVWEKSVIHPYYKRSCIRIMGNEHSLIHQAIHCFRDLSYNRYSTVDIHHLLKKINIENPSFRQLVDKNGCKKSFDFMISNYGNMNHESESLTGLIILSYRKCNIEPLKTVFKFIAYMMLIDRKFQVLKLVIRYLNAKLSK